MEMPVLRHDDDPGSSPQRISQPLRASYRAEPDYTLPCLPQPCARSPNLHGLLINVREMQPLVLRTVRCGIRQALAPAKPVTNFSDEVASGGRLEQPFEGGMPSFERALLSKMRALLGAADSYLQILWQPCFKNRLQLRNVQ